MEGLLPPIPKVHHMTARDFVRLTCFNTERAEKYNIALKNIALFLASKSIPLIYVDGSFMEKKDYPNDIDVFIEITLVRFAQIFQNHFSQWQLDMFNKYKCHAHVAISDFPNIQNTLLEGKIYSSHIEYWLYKFGESKDHYQKGIALLGTADILTETPT